MYAALRPYFTSGVVLVGASVLVVAPIHVPPPDVLQRTPVAADVLPTAAAIDIAAPDREDVRAFEIYAQALGTSALRLADLVGTTPAFLVDLARQVAEDPSKLPAAISAVVYRLVYLGSPKAADPAARIDVRVRDSILAAAIGPFLAALSQTLPEPLGGPDGLIRKASMQLAAAIATTLEVLLPEPLSTSVDGGGPATLQAMSLDDEQPNRIDDFTENFAILAHAAGLSARNTMYWIGAFPYDVNALARMVVHDPELLPRALSSVLHSLFEMPDYAPDTAMQARAIKLAKYSLLSGMVDPWVRALDQVLAPPLGSTKGETGWIAEAAIVLSHRINGLLDHLPPPLEIVDDGGMDTYLASVAAADPDRLLELTEAIHLVMTGLGNSAGSVLTFIGSVPTRQTDLVRFLLENPTKLPIAISTVIHGLVELPDNRKAEKVMRRVPLSLLDAALTPLARSLEQLPPPIGTSREGDPGVVERGMENLTDVVNGALRRLPPTIYELEAQQRAISSEQQTRIDRFDADFQDAFAALGQSVASLFDDLGAAPTSALVLARQVAEDPRLLPNAMSSVAWEINSARVDAARPLVEAASRIAPEPFGDDEETGDAGLIRAGFDKRNEAATRALEKLPPPLRTGQPTYYMKTVGTDDPADPGASVKTRRTVVNLNVKRDAQKTVRNSLGAVKDAVGKAGAKATDSVGKHRQGLGKRSVADHVAKRDADKGAQAAAE